VPTKILPLGPHFLFDDGERRKGERIHGRHRIQGRSILQTRGYGVVHRFPLAVVTGISLQTIDEFFNIPEERLLPLKKPGKEKWTSSFAVAMRKKVSEKATTYATKWQEAKRRYEGLRMSVLDLHGRKQRRGLVDAGGVVLNWFFGIAKQRDLDILDRKMAQSMNNINCNVIKLKNRMDF
jgi:hypothetical protein